MRLLRCWSLHRRGALAELAPLLRDYVRDAERRGDRYARTTLVRSCHRVLLGRTAKEARDELERADWVPAEGRYHLQHWYLFASRAEFSLYENNSGTMMDAARENDRRIQQALLLRVQSVRVDFQWLRARLILANAAQSSSRSAELRKVKKFARRLTGEGVGYASVAAKLLLASVAVQQSAPDRACEVLRVAVQQAEEEDMLLHAGAAQCRLGELLGGDEGAQLIGLGAERMKAEGATDVPRMTEMLVPGFTAD